MKITKRIFIALLILAVSVSSFAIFASAEENEMKNYANLLEYYEEQSLIDYNFGETVDYSADFLTNTARKAQYVSGFQVDDTVGQYLSVAIKERSGRSAYTDMHSYFAWTSAEAMDDFNIDLTVSGAKYNSSATENDENLPKIIIVVGDTEFTNIANAKTEGTTVAAIDYRGGYFTYLKAVDENGTVVGKTTTTTYEIKEGNWYDVSLTYDVDGGLSITVTNTANAEDTITVTDGFIPYAEVRDVRIGAHGDDNGSARGSEAKYARVRLLGGVYHRDVANMQADIEAQLLEMHALFLDDTSSIDAKISVCEVAKQLIAYGFTSANTDVLKALEELSVGAVGLYNNRIEQFVATVNTLATFAEKRAYADEVLAYVESLKALDISESGAEMIARSEKNIADFNALNDKLIAVAEDSAAFIATAETFMEHDLNDYALVTADIALLAVYEIDPTFEGIEETYKLYNKLVASEKSIRESAELFIAAVNTANDSTLDFNTRVAAYRTIEDLYMDNETYPGITEALRAYNEDVKAYMALEVSNAENFIKYVKKADYASYLSAKQENLDIAKTYMDVCQPSFAGVAEAKVLYAEVEAFIAQQLANAKAYVEAVNALDSLSGAALENGIKNAQSLQEAGNVLGVEGVTEANVKLNQLIASIELVERYCIHFVNLVASLDKATDIQAKFEILADAKAAEADADKSYAGVADASAKLAKAISDFNAQVEAINAEFEKANEVAANSCNVGGNATPVSGQVAALVKKFFDEE